MTDEYSSARTQSSQIGVSQSDRAVPDDLERFFEMLRNKGNPRRGGFVAFVTGLSNLGGLQALCLDRARSAKRCLTARYRVEDASGFGTLFAAFHTDLWSARAPGSPYAGPRVGEFLPPLDSGADDSPWSALLKSPGFYENPGYGGQTRGNIRELISKILNGLGDPTTLPRGSRLLLFFEVTSSRAAGQDWDSETQSLLEDLPERVGVVVTGAPLREMQVTTTSAENKQVLLIKLPQELDRSNDSEIIPTYVDSALSGDQPADRDRLGVAGYAEALARLVLLSETRPITVGIHGPWGRGKSSFLRFIRQSLVTRSGANERSGQSRQLEEIEAAILDLDRRLQLEGNAVNAEFNRRVADLDMARRALLKKMERAARRDLVLVDFNAWRYESAAEIWAGLAAEILRAFESCMGWPRRFWSRLAYALSRSGVETGMRLVIPALVAVAITYALWLVGSQRLISQALPQLPDWATLTSTATCTAPTIRLRRVCRTA